MKVDRVSKVVKGGRRASFRALVVVGDRRGRVGYGHGRAREVQDAIEKAKAAAKLRMVKIARHQGRTPIFDVDGKHGASSVVIRKAPEGTGMIAGGAMRPVLDAVGFGDVVAKCLGSRNPFNLVPATFDALVKLPEIQAVAARRGISRSLLEARMH